MARGLLRNGVISAATLVVLAGSLLTGCREEPAGLKAVNNASSRIGRVAGGAEAAVASDHQTAAFTEALRTLNEAKLESSNPMSGATSVLTAAAHLGAVGPASETAMESMRLASLVRSEVLSARAQWVTLSLVAQASAFDPQPILAEHDKQLTAAKNELSETQQRLGKLQADQDKMMADARDKADQANKFELESVKLREQTRAMSATDAQPILAKALEAKAKCDDLRLALANVEAEATLIEPRKLEIKQRQQELEIGIKSIEAERERTQKRAEESSVVEKQAREKAASAAKTVDDLVKKLNDERGRLLPAFDQVADACRKAASSSAAAKSSGRDAGGAAVTARAQQRLGELLLVRSAESAEYAALMQDLAAAVPALPGKASYGEAAKTAGDAAKASKDEAKDALEKARSAYQSLKPKGEAGQQAQAEVVKYLTKIGGLTPVDGEAPADAAAPANGEAPAETPKDGSAVEKPVAGADAEVREVLASIKADWSDDLKQLEWMTFDTVKVLNKDVATTIAKATMGLDAACKEKFGQSVTEYSESKGSEGGTAMNFGKLDPATASVTVNGETAEVSDGKDSATLRKVDGKWLIDVGAREAKLLERARGNEKLFALIFKITPVVMAEVEADVRSGAIEKIEDVEKATQTKLQAAVMKEMTPPGNGG